jgi:uncharacterized protein YyaL (SSP411 family)
LLLADGAAAQKTLAKLLPFLEAIKPVDGKPTAYVCVNYACQLPTTEAGLLKKSLEQRVGDR